MYSKKHLIDFKFRKKTEICTTEILLYYIFIFLQIESLMFCGQINSNCIYLKLIRNF